MNRGSLDSMWRRSIAKAAAFVALTYAASGWSAEPLRGFISVDMECLTGVVAEEEVSRGKPL